MAYHTLNQLYQTLRSKTESEKITAEEVNSILSCHLKVLRVAGFASGIVGCLAWSAARKLTNLRGLQRFGLAAGTAFTVFIPAVDWASAKTAVSFLDHILGQDATRMQKELVNLLVRYNHGEAWSWNLMSKYFYPESVYIDELDKPQMRWRRRNTSYDSVLPSRETNEAKPSNHSRSSPPGSDVSVTKPKPQNSSGNSDNEIAEDPFLCLFGGLETTESDHSQADQSGSSKAQTRKQRRAHRKQRLKNREASGHSPA
ncbi:PREDICTED: uncharacterized protein LOC104826165 isoform X2 [Tarenaya hassleriana]|uniref:uncharacterized protein LOC104826165 isoform X2 n=1 Tax=Tarenaya hassleriana TaxID=28532 RepID=UPI00053C5688|nr:PREDICTED: uncharacterized protein LOC104826165 isoform X2 [Tarenaya hassleriana]